LEPEPNPNACPGCGGGDWHALFEATDRLYRTTRERFHIVECGKCRLMRLYPPPRPADSRRYERPAVWPLGSTLADRIERAYRHFILTDDVNFVLRALDHAGETGPVLDRSPEGGPFLRALEAHGVEVIPAEAGSAASECAAVTLFHVLEHAFDPVRELEAARALLRPEGRLILQSPNAGCWQFLLLGENWSGIDVPRHLVQFRNRDLEALLDYCGFEIVRRKHFSLRNPAGLATSLAPWLDPAVRRARGAAEGPRAKLFKHLLYFGLVVAAVPFTVLEAACRAGSRITLEARRKF
jgi:hypothetical protein